MTAPSTTYDFNSALVKLYMERGNCSLQCPNNVIILVFSDRFNFLYLQLSHISSKFITYM